MEMDDDTPVVIDEQGRIHDGRTFSGGRARVKSRLPVLAVVLGLVAMVAIGVAVAWQVGPARAGGPPPPPVSAADFLDQEAQRGEAGAMSILDRWIPQLSAVRMAGLRADGTVYDDASIQRGYEGLKQRSRTRSYSGRAPSAASPTGTTGWSWSRAPSPRARTPTRGVRPRGLTATTAMPSACL